MSTAACETRELPIELARCAAEVPASLLARPTSGHLLRSALLDWIAILGAWVALAFAPWPLAAVLVLVVAGRIQALGVLLHDLVHVPRRARGPREVLLEVLTGAPVASTALAMGYHHLRHHRHAGTRGDPYFSEAAAGRPLVQALLALRLAFMVPFWTIRAPFGVLALGVPALRNLYARAFLLDRTGRDLRDDPEVLACARGERGQVLVHALAHGSALAFLGPRAVLVGYAIPALLAGLLCGIRDALDHRALPEASASREKILETACDHDLGLVGALLIAPHHVGCHVVHHLHPDVSQERLPALREWYVERLGPRYPAPRALVS
ncbi:fatty acid desaturase [bacterium]|nr:fatty acid desaturase [bacterium]